MTLSFRPIPGRLWIVQFTEHIGRRLKAKTHDWPKDEKESVGDQLVRSIDAVGSDITEGYTRTHVKERLHFLSRAQGSLEEALYWLRRARDRQLIPTNEAGELSTLIIKLSRALANLAAAQQPKEW